jgi:dTDP-4-amino-4,6-dideoxygalactose transaminase
MGAMPVKAGMTAAAGPQGPVRRPRTEIDDAVRRVMESTRFIGGPEVTGLEEEVARYSQTPRGGVRFGHRRTAASLWALGVGPGDEVVTSAYSFFASAGTISNNGATPVFVDIDPRTYNLDVHKLEGPRSRRAPRRSLPCTCSASVPT